MFFMCFFLNRHVESLKSWFFFPKGSPSWATWPRPAGWGMDACHCRKSRHNACSLHCLHLMCPHDHIGKRPSLSCFQLRRINKSTRNTFQNFTDSQKSEQKWRNTFQVSSCLHPYKRWMCARSTVLPSSQQHFTSHLPNRSHSSSIHIYSIDFYQRFLWDFYHSAGYFWSHQVRNGSMFDPGTSSKSQVRLPMQFLG